MEDVHAVDESDARARLVCRRRAPGGGGVRRDRSTDRAHARARPKRSSAIRHAARPERAAGARTRAKTNAIARADTGAGTRADSRSGAAFELGDRAC